MIWTIVKRVTKVGIRTEAAPEIGDVTQLEIGRIQLDVLAILGQALTSRMVDAGSRNMATALQRTYEATPEPRLVVAVGDCGCDGGIFDESYASRGPVSSVIPVDVLVPGCPPPPIEILRGILRAVRRGRNAVA